MLDEGKKKPGKGVEDIIKKEQLEKIKETSRNVFNNALSLLFDPDEHIEALVKAKNMAFAIVVAAIFIILNTIAVRVIGPLTIAVTQRITLQAFLVGIVLYLGWALGVWFCVRIILNKASSYLESLNIISVSFIPLIAALILCLIFSVASTYISAYIYLFGYLVSILLLYNAIRTAYNLSIRESIYLLPIVYTVGILIVHVFLKIFF